MQSSQPGRTPIVAIVGPTASGKTALSLDLAGRLGGEIVNTDAMQVYRGMDVGTAKLPVEERRGIPHHLLDTLEVRDPATVAEFQRWARAEIAALRAAGRPPVLVGGSALYTRAILDRFEFPGTDPAVRARLEGELAEVGSPALHRRLAEADPAAAERIEVDNGRRVVRALEVIEITGRPFSATLPVLEYVDPATIQIGVAIDRGVLEERIRLRVDLMFADGFVAEVERLLTEGLAESRTAAAAIGYRQVMDHLAGEIDLAEAKERTVIATRRFARRQMAWWKNDPRIHWLEYDDPDRVAKALALVGSVSG
ncbi:tRNA (adenosine(37)-N6)-dimethylallyltransferase MiaA [Nocardioides sp. GY 10113]|uniref:tRNA (adenosine(37)-N6)-dimethylallyltransferase MiaA n=1 Tax=Nocardioides sp. GY 10113 TaxID=2569761 RepID=UPI0010A85599|nr:tRNA (adenosine(37)-N6)-dimethylallyltransferase MiaA [Nocardioides sp. GY 10113]TIC85939.1 tRNA (adenosine(37)-N6)-dimethylallyltransferase MiaA [Nocardioides sp. GY 10113]